MTSGDAFLGGRLNIRQPARGFRAGLDSVMLAAAVPAASGEAVLELGSGAGVAALCLAARVAGLHVTGIEIQPDLVEQASENAAANGLAVTFLESDAGRMIADLPRDHFNHVMMNPPFFVEGRDDSSPDPARRTAAIADIDLLARWTKTARTHLRARGTLTAIAPADRLAALLAALGTGFGGITIYPLWPRTGQPAKRILVAARKGSRAPLVLKAGLVLHGADGAYTPRAERILRSGALLPV